MPAHTPPPFPPPPARTSGRTLPTNAHTAFTSSHISHPPPTLTAPTTLTSTHIWLHPPPAPTAYTSVACRAKVLLRAV